MFAIFDDVISRQECDVLKSRIEAWHYLNCSDDPNHLWDWKRRILDITPSGIANRNNPYERNFLLTDSLIALQDEICKRVKQILEKNLNIQLNLGRAELQVWPINTNGPAHNHNDGRLIDYNSLLYLNDDFNGGEFYTETGIIVRPAPGRLTFFNGKNINHGVADIYDNNRYTVIFWWKETKFK